MARPGDPFAEPVRLHEDTKFPHIEGQRAAFLRAVERVLPPAQQRRIVRMEGTVKLDGMHADIVFDITEAEAASLHRQRGSHSRLDQFMSWSGQEDGISQLVAGLMCLELSSGPRFQTRNTLANSDVDNTGFPSALQQHSQRLSKLKTEILARFVSMHPTIAVSIHHPLIIAGEWSRGRKTKDALGFDRLSKTFVITTIAINGQWQRDSDFAGIEAPEIGIYNIQRAPTYTMLFDLALFKASNPTFEIMQALADQVEVCDPFVESLGMPKEQCRGEGIVWKIGTPEGRANARCWIKMKGPRFRAWENRMHQALAKYALAKYNTDNDERAKARQLALQLVTPRRVEQGIEFLQEIHLPVEKNHVKTFIDWVSSDVRREEETAIRESGLDKYIKLEVDRAARDRYFEEIGKRQ